MDGLIINDKFNIIGNYNSNFGKTQLKSWISHLFNNNESSYSNDIIHQYLYDYTYLKKNDVDELFNIINKTVEKEIIIRVKNITPKIRKNAFNLNEFQNVLNSILNVVKKINDTVYILNKHRNKYFNTEEFVKYYWGMSIVYKFSLHHIFSKFIDHTIIKKYIENNMVALDDENKNGLIHLFRFVYKLKNYIPECFEYFSQNFINNMDNHMNQEAENNIPINMGVFSYFNEFNKKMNIYNQIDEYYNFIDKDTKKKLINNLTKNLADILIKIFECNISKNEIKIVMDFSHKNHSSIENVWKQMENSDSVYDKNLFVNVIMKFINNKIEILVPDCKTMSGFIKFIEFFDKAISLNNIFNNDENLTTLGNKFSSNLQSVISSNNEFIDIMCKLINNKMKEIDQFDTNEDNLRSITNIIQLLNYIQNKDVFYAKYSHYLMTRLLSKTNMNYEKKLVDTIESIQDYSYVKKLHKMIEDINNSLMNMENYNMIKINQTNNSVDKNFNVNKLHTLTFSYNAWDICLNKTNTNLKDFSKFTHSPQLKSYLLTFDKFYKTKFPGRNLNWYLEMGSIEVSFNKMKLIVNPYQMCVIEMFNDNDSLSMEEITDYLENCFGKNNYDSIVKSFVISGLLTKDNLQIKLNSNFSDSKEVINLIEIYNNISNYDTKVEEKIKRQITLDRETVIQANIINILKLQSMTAEVLHQTLTKNLEKYFEVDKKLVDDNLKEMLSKDYLSHQDNHYKYMIY